MPGNNCFGIKPDDHGAGVQYFVSREYLHGAWQERLEAFEKYDSLADCFIDHSRPLTRGRPYAAAWAAYLQDHDMDRLIRAVGPIYGSDPNYAGKILAEAHSSSVAIAVQVARAAQL
jgi:flagellum-specific peptidoglycan hydrolase FlgJ